MKSSQYEYFKQRRFMNRYGRGINALWFIGGVILVIAFLTLIFGTAYAAGVGTMYVVGFVPYHFPVLNMLVGVGGSLSAWVTKWA